MGASESLPERRIALLGKTGDGKSSAGNTILRKYEFSVEVSPESVTSKCSSREQIAYGRMITVIDTPGIFDTHHNEETIKSDIIKSVIECAPAVDAFVIILKVGRFTRHELEIVDKIKEYCGEDVFQHSVVLFTHGEELKNLTIEEFVQKSPNLQELADKCGGRCHVIDNTFWTFYPFGYKSNRVQVKNLLESIDVMVDNNGLYSNEVFQKVEEKIQEVEKNITERLLSPREKRQKAKEVIHKEYVIKLAGVATGSLIGAFLGIGVAVNSVLTLLQPEDLPTVIQNVKDAAETVAKAFKSDVNVDMRAGITAAGVVFGVSSVAGAVGGAVSGYRAAEEADSLNDAVKKAAAETCAHALEINKTVQELASGLKKKKEKTN